MVELAACPVCQAYLKLVRSANKYSQTYRKRTMDKRNSHCLFIGKSDGCPLRALSCVRVSLFALPTSLKDLVVYRMRNFGQNFSYHILSVLPSVMSAQELSTFLYFRVFLFLCFFRFMYLIDSSSMVFPVKEENTSIQKRKLVTWFIREFSNETTRCYS